MTEPEKSSVLDRIKKFLETWALGVTVVGATVALVAPALPAVRAMGWAAHWLLVGSGCVALLGGLFYAYRRVRRAEGERDAQKAARAVADKMVAELRAELETERRRAEEQRAEEIARWPARDAVKSELLLNTNVGERHFRNETKYGSAFASVALLVLRTNETRVQLTCRVTNRAPYAVTLEGMRVEATVCALHGLRFKADEPNVRHAFKELAPGQSELVRVELRVAAVEWVAADSAHLAVVGAVFVRSERWKGVEEVPISTSTWGIIVDERPPKPVFDEQVPPYRSPLQGGGF